MEELLKYKDNQNMTIGAGEEFMVSQLHGSHFQNHTRRNNMDVLITIAFLTLYYILGLGTVITLKTGLEEDVKLEGADYLMAAGFPILLFVVFLDWIVRKIVR